MKIPKFLSLVLAISLVGVMVAGCSKKAVTTTTTTSEVTVGTGNVIVSITSTGSMDYSDYENLSFATDGTVGAVNAKVGDLVTKGQVLATLDSDAWNTYLDSLTQAVQTAQSNLTNAQSTITSDQRQVATKQLGVTQAQLGVAQAQLGVTQAQLGVLTAQNNLNNINAVKIAQDAVDAAQANIDAAQANLNVAMAQGDAGNADFLYKYINGDPSIPGSTGLKGVLAQAKQNLQQVVSGTSTTLSNSVVLQIASAQQQVSSAQLQVSNAQLQVLQAQDSLVNAQAAVDTANTAVANAQANEAAAEQAVKDAQTALNTARSTNIQITAPFDGAITTVSITQSGTAKKGATAIVIADTSKFKASLMVNETDIPNISVGTLANVTATALPNVTLSARVTAISPVATVQSGVVNYAVTATILGVATPTRQSTSTTGNSSGQSGTVTTTRSTSTQTGTATTPTTTGRSRIITDTPGQSGTSIILPTTLPFGNGGTPPTDLAPGNGGQFSNLTPDQIAQFQQGQAARQSNAAASTTVQLRQGLSLTVNLIEQQALNVITVPNTAIKTISGKTYVEVKTSSGTPEQREVTTGLKDYQNTEIVSGLSVGDVVLITKTSSTAKTTTTTPGGFNIGGGILR